MVPSNRQPISSLRCPPRRTSSIYCPYKSKPRPCHVGVTTVELVLNFLDLLMLLVASRTAFFICCHSARFSWKIPVWGNRADPAHIKSSGVVSVAGRWILGVTYSGSWDSMDGEGRSESLAS